MNGACRGRTVAAQPVRVLSGACADAVGVCRCPQGTNLKDERPQGRCRVVSEAHRSSAVPRSMLGRATLVTPFQAARRVRPGTFQSGDLSYRHISPKPFASRCIRLAYWYDSHGLSGVSSTKPRCNFSIS